MNILDSQSVGAFIYKSAGMTSHDVVSQLRKAFPGLKVGHGGTLDPFATGVLPVFFGTWTRLASLFSFSDKRYQAQIELGTCTDTGDWTGKVTYEKKIPLYNDLQLKMLERQLHGSIELPVPIYSALKVNGKPMHELARKGEITQSIRSRKTILHAVSLKPGKLGHQLILDVSCSHGTYIRSLGEHIAKQLHTVGHLSSLERTSYTQGSKVVPFPSIKLEDFKVNPQNGIITLHMLEDLLPVYHVSASGLRDLFLGRQKYVPFRIDGWRIAKYDNHIVAVIFTENGKITQRIFMPLTSFSAVKAVEKKSFSGYRLSCLEG